MSLTQHVFGGKLAGELAQPRINLINPPEKKNRSTCNYPISSKDGLQRYWTHNQRSVCKQT